MNTEQEKYFLRKQQEQNEKKELRIIGLFMGAAVIAYLIFQSVAVTLLDTAGLRTLYQEDPVFYTAFNIIGVSFFSVALPFGLMALVNKKRYAYPVIPSAPVKTSKCVMWVSVGMLCCTVSQFVVSYLIAFLQLLFDVKFTQGTPVEPNSVFACVLTVIGTAIIPGICEEFAMRCCCVQLLRKYGKSFGVVAVSIVFGILHGNVIQFIFAFIVGLVLGYITVKTDSIVPAVLIHTFSNGVSVLSSVITYAAGEKAATAAVTAAYAFWAVAGIISGIYMLSKGEFKTETQKYNGVLTIGQKFSAFLFPGMIVPFVILIFMTAATIEF